MKGLIKKFDYDNLKIDIVPEESYNIKKELIYTFENEKAMSNCFNKFLVEFESIDLNGLVKNISFDYLIINDIEIQEIVGSGANAIVYRGYDKFFERKVAVKIWIPVFF